jgi:hypothetical protein
LFDRQTSADHGSAKSCRLNASVGLAATDVKTRRAGIRPHFHWIVDFLKELLNVGGIIGFRLKVYFRSDS